MGEEILEGELFKEKFKVVCTLSPGNREVFYEDSVRTLNGNVDQYTFNAETLEEILTHVRLNNLHNSLDKISIKWPTSK